MRRSVLCLPLWASEQLERLAIRALLLATIPKVLVLMDFGSGGRSRTAAGVENQFDSGISRTKIVCCTQRW